MASGDSIETFKPLQNLAPSWLFVEFTSGSVAFSQGDTIWGDTSNANAVVEVGVLVSGTFAGGDAAGYMLLSNWNRVTFTSGENFTFNSTTPANDGTFTLAPVDAFAESARLNHVDHLNFSNLSNEVALFRGVMPRNYGSGGVTVTLGVTSTAIVNNIRWNAHFKSITPAVDNLNDVGVDPSGLKPFATPQSITMAAPATAGLVATAAIPFLDGAEMDGILVGELFFMLIERDAQSALDTVTADASLEFAELIET